jgi:hypothetical protein
MRTSSCQEQLITYAQTFFSSLRPSNPAIVFVRLHCSGAADFPIFTTGFAGMVAMFESAGHFGPTDLSSSNDPTAFQKSSTPSPSTDAQIPQTKRILGIIPNFRAVSANQVLPPQSAKEKFITATEDSFDYSALPLPAALTGYSMATNATPEFHQGAAGYSRYLWHSDVDQSIENYAVEFVVPALTHEDIRYYRLGKGGLLNAPAMRSAASSSHAPMPEPQPLTAAKLLALAQPRASPTCTIRQASEPSETLHKIGVSMSVSMPRLSSSKNFGRISTMPSFILGTSHKIAWISEDCYCHQLRT